MKCLIHIPKTTRIEILRKELLKQCQKQINDAILIYVRLIVLSRLIKDNTLNFMYSKEGKLRANKGELP
jgi:hypothetical protein